MWADVCVGISFSYCLFLSRKYIQIFIMVCGYSIIKKLNFFCPHRRVEKEERDRAVGKCIHLRIYIYMYMFTRCFSRTFLYVYWMMSTRCYVALEGGGGWAEGPRAVMICSASPMKQRQYSHVVAVPTPTTKNIATSSWWPRGSGEKKIHSQGDGSTENHSEAQKRKKNISEIKVGVKGEVDLEVLAMLIFSREAMNDQTCLRFSLGPILFLSSVLW